MLLDCHPVSVKMRHNNVGHHTQKIGLEEVRNTFLVDCEVGQESSSLDYYFLVRLDLQNID